MLRDKINQDLTNKIKNIKCFALDMDGTIYLGEQWIEGAKDFLKAVEASGREYIFVTNNSSKNPKAYVEKLLRMGLEVNEDKIITSGSATASVLKKEYTGKRVFLLGNELLRKQLEDEGIEVTDAPVDSEDSADIAVVGFDTTLDYHKLCVVCDYVRAGVSYISTHPDINCPTETGFIPDAGAIHALIQASTGRLPDRIIGKPNAGIVDYMLARTGRSRTELAMVGDRLYTDVAAGVNNGLTGILVLSGEAKAEDAEVSETKPHLIFNSVKDIIPFL